MASRPVAIVLAAASLGLLSIPALAQDAPTPQAASAPQAAPPPTVKHEAKPRKAPAKTVAKPSAKSSAKSATKPSAKPAVATGAPRLSTAPGEETEAASLERRRRAFFATKPDAAAPEAEAPPAGVTLGGSGGISPGMGFKF